MVVCSNTTPSASLDHEQGNMLTNPKETCNSMCIPQVIAGASGLQCKGQPSFHMTKPAILEKDHQSVVCLSWYIMSLIAFRKIHIILRVNMYIASNSVFAAFQYGSPAVANYERGNLWCKCQENKPNEKGKMCRGNQKI